MKDLRERASEVNTILQSYLPADTKEFGDIAEAMSYSVLAGGKRLRAIMLLESFRLFNGDADMEKLLAWPFAAAIEFIHAYSLVHDDLPSMDNDMYRRGIPTTHAKYGHAMGVLAGDALLNYAMETVTSAMVGISSLHSEMVSELYRRASLASSIIFTKAGFSGMIGGQVLDINAAPASSNTDPGLSKIRLLKTYELKTSALLQASVCAGAALAGATDGEIKKLESIAYHMGIAFQIRDDILDETSSLEQLGKDVHNDARNDKTTIASLCGIQKSQQMVDERLDSALALIGELPGNTLFFRELIDYLRTREA